MMTCRGFAMQGVSRELGSFRGETAELSTRTLCVQEASMFSESQSRQERSQNLVAWMAAVRETDRLRPIDKAVLRIWTLCTWTREFSSPGRWPALARNVRTEGGARTGSPGVPTEDIVLSGRARERTAEQARRLRSIDRATRPHSVTVISPLAIASLLAFSGS